jgi:hypothetical protein
MTWQWKNWFASYHQRLKSINFVFSITFFERSFFFFVPRKISDNNPRKKKKNNSIHRGHITTSTSVPVVPGSSGSSTNNTNNNNVNLRDLCSRPRMTLKCAHHYCYYYFYTAVTRSYLHVPITTRAQRILLVHTYMYVIKQSPLMYENRVRADVYATCSRARRRLFNNVRNERIPGTLWRYRFVSPSERCTLIVW